MLRTLAGFALFALVALIAFKLLVGLFGAFFGLLMSLLWFAFLGWLFYLALKILAPGTAARIREVITGKPAGA
ncbi:MAG TPA: hypothetical protein VHJ69_00230 [Gemmatimonadales bacterium]|jgi:hypothetical protein|nr:hypothetical protein [Gemmatimonadales bacterium]